MLLHMYFQWVCIKQTKLPIHTGVLWGLVAEQRPLTVTADCQWEHITLTLHVLFHYTLIKKEGPQNPSSFIAILLLFFN